MKGNKMQEINYIDKYIKQWKESNITLDKVQDLVNMLIREREDNKVKPTKWEPSVNGSYLVGPFSIIDLLNKPITIDQIRAGRIYNTKSQAEEAFKFQRAAMRFFKWCIEYDSDFKFEDLDKFSNLLFGKMHKIYAETFED